MSGWGDFKFGGEKLFKKNIVKLLSELVAAEIAFVISLFFQTSQEFLKYFFSFSREVVSPSWSTE